MFGWFRKDPLRVAIKAAYQALRKGAHEEAFHTLRRLCPNEAYAQNRKQFLRLLKAIEEVGFHFGGDTFSVRLAPCLDEPDLIENLYESGCYLIDCGLHAFATLPLQRLYHLEPDDPAHVSALATAYEGLFMNDEIIALIRAGRTEVQQHPECYYLLTFHEIMTGNIEEARGRLPTLERLLPGDHAFLFERVRDMIARYDSLRSVRTLDTSDLVGWHYVKSGGLLTHVSPYGFTEGMHGRYALVQDSYPYCRYGLERLKTLLDAWQVQVPLVYFGRDRSSRILATAAAQLFKVPLEPLAQASGPGLIVLYDLSELEGDDWERITYHHPGRFLYVHTLNWVEPPSISPDVVTMLHQLKFAPWSAALNPEAGSEPDQRPVAEIAAEIVNAPALDPESTTYDPELVALAKATQGQASIFRQDGYRERFWQGGPVTSNMFL